MNLNRLLSSTLLNALALSLLTSVVSWGAVIYSVTGLTLPSTAPTQLGRLSRSGVLSDWSSQKAFPGILNATTSYHYATYVIPTSPFPYLQISFYDELGAPNLFASAYLNSYSPAGLATNYLGDEGMSGNTYGNPTSFQVTLAHPASNSLILVVNDASAVAAGIGQPFDFIVEGFYDTNFNDTTPPAPTVPEPATMTLSGAGIAIAALAALRRRKPVSI